MKVKSLLEDRVIGVIALVLAIILISWVSYELGLSVGMDVCR